MLTPFERYITAGRDGFVKDWAGKLHLVLDLRVHLEFTHIIIKFVFKVSGVAS